MCIKSLGPAFCWKWTYQSVPRATTTTTTIIVLVLLALNFIPQRSHQSLTLARSRIRDSATATRRLATATLMAATATLLQPSKWSHQHNRSAYFPKWKKAPKCTGGTITCPKHSHTTLTSLLGQPSTITCCDRFHRNCVTIDRTEPPIPTEQSL